MAIVAPLHVAGLSRRQGVTTLAMRLPDLAGSHPQRVTRCTPRIASMIARRNRARTTQRQIQFSTQQCRSQCQRVTRLSSWRKVRRLTCLCTGLRVSGPLALAQ